MCEREGPAGASMKAANKGKAVARAVPSGVFDGGFDGF